MMLCLLLLLVPINAFDCYSYAMGYKPSDPDVISMEVRLEYVPKLCGTLRTCHAKPQLHSYTTYLNDITRCYNERTYAFNTTLVDESTISNYIDVLHDLEEARLHYDSDAAFCRDEMTSIVDSVRLRTGYFREFQYSRSPYVSGDVLLLLKSERAIFENDVGHQSMDLERMTAVSVYQLERMTEMLSGLEGVYALISELQKKEVVYSGEFRKAVDKIQANVVASLLELSN